MRHLIATRAKSKSTTPSSSGITNRLILLNLAPGVYSEAWCRSPFSPFADRLHDALDGAIPYPTPTGWSPEPCYSQCGTEHRSISFSPYRYKSGLVIEHCLLKIALEHIYRGGSEGVWCQQALPKCRSARGMARNPCCAQNAVRPVLAQTFYAHLSESFRPSAIPLSRFSSPLHPIFQPSSNLIYVLRGVPRVHQWPCECASRGSASLCI